MPDSAFHKAEAERLLARADEIGASGGYLGGDPLLLTAQVHATLAIIRDEQVETRDVYEVAAERLEVTPETTITTSFAPRASFTVPPSEELVEKVARVLYESVSDSGPAVLWDRVPESKRGYWYDRARAVLAAIGGES